jgi:hypothetical protein
MVLTRCLSSGFHRRRQRCDARLCAAASPLQTLQLSVLTAKTHVCGCPPAKRSVAPPGRDKGVWGVSPKVIRPLVEEINRLEAAAIALAGAVGSAAL